MAPVHEESTTEDAATRTELPDGTPAETVRTAPPDGPAEDAATRTELPDGTPAETVRTAPPDGPTEDARTQAARRRVLWRDSPEYRAIAKWRWPALGIGVVLGVTVGILWFGTPISSRFDLSPVTHAITGVYAITIAFAMPSYAWFGHKRVARKAFEDRLTLGLVSELQAEEHQLAESEGKTDLASLWAVTQKRIDLYHGIATSQAENSFRVGQVAAMAGFVAVLSLGGLAAFTTSGTGAIAASVIGVAGAAMSGYIGATFLKSQAEASAQLRQFFLQPVQFSRMLAVERLIVDLPESEKAAAVQHIVKAMMAGQPDES